MMTPESMQKAIAVLEAGGLVAFPTETVYGLGADARNEEAIRKVFQAKKRPYDHPLIVHIAQIKQVSDWAIDIPPEATKLAEAFWPGPLTLILRKKPEVLQSLTGGQDTIGLRIPRHPIAQALLRAFGGGIAAPSANQFTHISPTTATAVHEELGHAVDLVLDGGACEVGLESTVIDMTREHPQVLRPGMITADDIENVLGKRPLGLTKTKSATRAPGMHQVHYAPVTKTLLVPSKQLREFIASLKPAELPAIVVTHTLINFPHSEQVHYVKMPHDAVSYAHDLYRTLRTVDHEHYKHIIIEAVPRGIAWDAIRDRIVKASGTRDNL